MEPQSRVSDSSRSLQKKVLRNKVQRSRTMAEVKKPSDLPKAKKHKPMDSDEDMKNLKMSLELLQISGCPR